MTDKLELKSSHEVIYTVDVADVESIFYCKPTDPDILTVLMKDGKRLYCDEVCPVDSLQEKPNAKFKVGQTITDPTDSTFTFHINKIEDGRYIEKEDEWVLVKEADANYELVEEPVSGDFEMALAEMIDNAQKRVVEPWVAAAQWKDELIELAKSEEPVSEELEEAASRYAKEEYSRKSPATLPDRCIGCYAPLICAFEAGAKWKEEQMTSKSK